MNNLVWFIGLQKLSAKLQLAATTDPTDPLAAALLKEVHAELSEGIIRMSDPKLKIVP